jgi:hypothetical protein
MREYSRINVVREGMRTLLPLVVVFLVACGGFKPTVPTVPDDVRKRVELRELPEDPAEITLPDGLPPGDWVVAYESKLCEMVGCHDKDGLVVSEERAWRDAMYRIKYRELRRFYRADQTVWDVHRELYETRLMLADQEIQRLQPSWWDKNKLQFGVVGGLIMGIATSVAILAVTDDVR